MFFIKGIFFTFVNTYSQAKSIICNYCIENSKVELQKVLTFMDNVEKYTKHSFKNCRCTLKG